MPLDFYIIYKAESSSTKAADFEELYDFIRILPSLDKTPFINGILRVDAAYENLNEILSFNEEMLAEDVYFVMSTKISGDNYTFMDLIAYEEPEILIRMLSFFNEKFSHDEFDFSSALS